MWKDICFTTAVFFRRRVADDKFICLLFVFNCSYSHWKHLIDIVIQRRAMTDIRIVGITTLSKGNPKEADFSNLIPNVRGNTSAMF